jgi:fatty acid desaturase
MSEELTPSEKRLRKAAALVLVGLIVEGLSLLSARPLAFVLFVGVGLLLMAVGIVMFLLTLVSHHEPARTPDGVWPDRAKEATQAQ